MPIQRFVLLAAICGLAVTGCSHRSRSGSVATANATTRTTASAARGAALFATQCAACHGDAGKGARIGPALAGERKHKDAEAVRAFILEPDPPMPKLYPSVLSAQDVDDLTAYVETL